LLDVLVTQVSQRNLPRSAHRAGEATALEAETAAGRHPVPHFRSLAEDLWLPPDSDFTIPTLGDMIGGVGFDAQQASVQRDVDRLRTQVAACSVAGVVFVALRAGGHLNYRNPIVDAFALGLLPMTWVGAGLLYDRRVATTHCESLATPI
jgi:hypothetical protein